MGQGCSSAEHDRNRERGLPEPIQTVPAQCGLSVQADLGYSVWIRPFGQGREQSHLSRFGLASQELPPFQALADGSKPRLFCTTADRGRWA